MKKSQKEQTSFSDDPIIGGDLAKRVFQLHGASGDRSVVFRKKLFWGKMLALLIWHAEFFIAMEALATVRGWGRKFINLAMLCV